MRFSEIGSVCICVNEYRNGEIRGEVLSAVHTKPDKFSGTLDLVRIINSLFDEADAPQSTMRLRTFSSYTDIPVRKNGKIFSEGSTVSHSGPTMLGKFATFTVNVMYRRNASWQGTLSWFEEEKEENFRSVLELLLLMDSALKIRAEQQ